MEKQADVWCNGAYSIQWKGKKCIKGNDGKHRGVLCCSRPLRSLTNEQTFCPDTFADQRCLLWHRRSILIDAAVTFARVCCAVAVVNEDKAVIDVTSLVRGVNVASVHRPLHTPQYHSMTVPFYFKQMHFTTRREGAF